MKPTIEDMIKLFSASGSQMYGGEAVSQLEHALQCAALAEAAGESKELFSDSLNDKFIID